MENLKNPFLLNGYKAPEYFCNREKEIRNLSSTLEGGINITLTSIRRIGKTGLIKHLFHHLSSHWRCIFIDIMATEDSTQFLNLLSTAIYNEVSEKEGFGKKVMNFIKGLRPTLSFDPLSYTPQLSFNYTPTESKEHIQSLLKFLEQQEEKIVIAIDEFQQITKYPEDSVDAWLRSTIQHLGNVRFIFSGSEQHLMNDLFSSPSKPFFRSTMMVNLKKIDREDYARFIKMHFSKSNKNIEEEVIGEMLDWCKTHTYYVQLLCNRVFGTGKRDITSDLWRTVAHKILLQEELQFYNYRNLLTSAQWKLLVAIAKEEQAYSITSGAFITKHGLGGSATILRSLKTLLKSELVHMGFDENGKKYFAVYDVLMLRWAQIHLQ